MKRKSVKKSTRKPVRKVRSRNPTRKHTRYLLEQVEQGRFDNETLIRDLLNFMSESDVKEFCEQYDYGDNTDEDE
jgi:hypothetical protein